MLPQLAKLPRKDGKLMTIWPCRISKLTAQRIFNSIYLYLFRLACLKIVDDDGAELDMDPSQIEQLTNENAFLGSSAEIVRFADTMIMIPVI